MAAPTIFFCKGCTGVPMKKIIFACVHNAGRSYAAHSIADNIMPENVLVLSAGTDPKDDVNPEVTKALKLLGYKPTDHKPSALTISEVKSADFIVTMGCGESCPVFNGKTYLNWELEDPSGKSEKEVLVIVRQIEQNVIALMKTIQNNKSINN